MNLNDMVELSTLVPNASEVKEQTKKNEIYKKAMEENIKNINQRINNAKNEGFSFCHWNVNNKYEDDLKQIYKSKGYYWKPTGYCGGVWQETEEICW